MVNDDRTEQQIERLNRQNLGRIEFAPQPSPIGGHIDAPAQRPEGWLDAEIELTAFALANPDCNVRAVLRGFAVWVLDGVGDSSSRTTR